MQITKYPNTPEGKLDLEKKAQESCKELFTTSVSISFRIFSAHGKTLEFHVIYF